MQANNPVTKVTTEGKKVTIIPATKSLHPERDGVKPNREKIRVAAYCRVSTTLEEQQGSYELQKRYYEKLINSNPVWEPAGIYGDEGKSGTSLKGRDGFLEMMDDVRAGKIDYIITKATSRFGRNNAEFIQILDELESYGVEVLFESEGIVTSGQQNRTMLQVIGATNEHYSSTLSKNIRWSKERNMREGKVSISYKSFLGYEKGPDGEPRIVEAEAKIVREIFSLFLEGRSYASIARYLNGLDIPTAADKEWRGEAVKRILVNEKYTGDVLLQKTYKRDFLDKRSHKNQGEKPQVLVENNHEAIIDKATFARAQELIKKRTRVRHNGTEKSPFVGKIICADCGEYFGHKTWASRGSIKYSMWVCNHKYSEETTYGGNKCKTANLRQEWIEQGYIHTMNQILARRSEYLAKYGRKLSRITRRLESGEIEAELKVLDRQLAEIDQKGRELDTEYEFSFGRQDEFKARQLELKTQMQETLNHITDLENERNELNAEKNTLKSFIAILESLPDKLTKFSDKAFLSTINHISVNKYVLAYHLYGDECIKVNIEKLKLACH